MGVLGISTIHEKAPHKGAERKENNWGKRWIESGVCAAARKQFLH
jgi:hypothetical protein